MTLSIQVIVSSDIQLNKANKTIVWNLLIWNYRKYDVTVYAEEHYCTKNCLIWKNAIIASKYCDQFSFLLNFHVVLSRSHIGNYVARVAIWCIPWWHIWANNLSLSPPQSCPVSPILLNGHLSSKSHFPRTPKLSLNNYSYTPSESICCWHIHWDQVVIQQVGQGNGGNQPIQLV